MKSIDLPRIGYASPEISVETLEVENGFAASGETFGTKELGEESYSFEWE